ncbi:MAG: hypothetical protein JWP26_436 [Devosia sp.]|uniref:hypothetical protein n=1 Tax=Devosia sp. TaxID=1871048 RepID=UPI00261A4FAE|nr:hypothetical protein [Devosia sp.]MDB5585466.1 hypothetical protein [Devosia sp.]
MNRIIITALAAGLLVNTAFAQDAAVPAAPEDPNAPSVAVEGGAPVELGTTDEKTDVQIVLLSELPENATPLDVTEDKDELATLHASITDNPAVKAKLDAGGYTVEDVVAMENNVDGSIVVYVDDRG